MRVFLTGATGLIGSRVARTLAARGDALTCLVRESSDTTPLSPTGATLITGDITEASALDRGLDGADAAIHMAAQYDIGVVDRSEMERINVGGTGAFIDAITRAGTPNAVYVSSTAALGPSDGSGDTDTGWRGPYPSVYHRTKAEAHRLARTAAHAGTPLTVVSPAFGYGPDDQGPAGQFIDDLVHGRVPGLLRRPGWFSYVYIDDVADGIVAALDHGPATSHFILGGEDATVNDFAERVCSLAGRRPPALRLPKWMVVATGVLLDGVSRVTGARFTISRESVEVSAGLRWLHPYELTKQTLGWTPRPLSEGLPPTVAYYRSR